MDNALHESLELELDMEQCALDNLHKDLRTGDKLGHASESVQRAESKVASLKAQLAG